MEKKTFKIESLFYLFLIISPFFDAASFLLHTYVPDLKISLTAILRPIIPMILLLSIFITEKKEKKKIILGGLVYCLYAIGHLYFYQRNLTGSAYGGVFSEAQYVFNYTYMIALFYLTYYFLKKDKLPQLSKYTFYFLLGYVFLLYLALLTGTSSHTYIDGNGYKGWNASGNSVCSILLLTSCLVLPEIKKEKKWYLFVMMILIGIYLMFLLGTRTALVGFPFILIVYGICLLLFRKGKVRTFLRKYSWKLAVLFLILVGGGIFLLSKSETFSRQKDLSDQGSVVVDAVTGKSAHITGDATKYVKQIQDGEMAEEFMDKAQQKALLALYQKGNEWNLQVKERRVQQLIYHTYLVKEQHDPFRILFGNGYHANYYEMVLEMELPALLYNFGILGFILYFGPFLWMLGKSVVVFVRKRKKVDSTYVFYLFTEFFAIVLSFLCGYTFFHVSCMLIIIILYCRLDQKREELLR